MNENLNDEHSRRPLAIEVLKMNKIFCQGKRLQNIADNADRKAHNLYLNHTQEMCNAGYVDYDEETVCSSDISEVYLNLNTYKPSTSNRLISLTHPKHKQLTSFVSESSQMRLGLLQQLWVETSLESRTGLWLQLV
ncbi:hypothetical protein AVEN_110075-1 [Araneus ventricosus]|uniref:Uncharacterized protein n=1 Tax=Araneus ventricosus TaxID=182803 RepID=A0A4Y2UHU5_ARAVE|nr:hypothetical protein AVEN_110075-1 [Araneus ventricosus]